MNYSGPPRVGFSFGDEQSHFAGEITDPEGAAEAARVAQQYYITYITLARFDPTGRMGRRLTPAYILDLATLERKVALLFLHVSLECRLLRLGKRI